MNKTLFFYMPNILYLKCVSKKFSKAIEKAKNAINKNNLANILSICSNLYALILLVFLG